MARVNLQRNGRASEEDEVRRREHHIYRGVNREREREGGSEREREGGGRASYI